MTKRTRTLPGLIALALLAPAAPAAAQPLSEDGYRATMTEIDALQAEMLAAIDKIQASLAPEEAIGMAPHMWERLEWLRGEKVKAAQADTSKAATSGGGGMKGLPPYARCIVMRAGLLDDALQDIATDLSLRAQGTPNDKLLPLDRKDVAGQTRGSGCP